MSVIVLKSAPSTFVVAALVEASVLIGKFCFTSSSSSFSRLIHSHEKPSEDQPTGQSNKDRFASKNDPIALKILERQKLMQEENQREREKVISFLQTTYFPN